jgi:hypothetical protein
MTDHPTTGTASSSARALTHLQPNYPSRRPEPPVRRQDCRGDEGNTPSLVHATCVTASTMIESGTVLVPRGQVPKNLGATCVKRASPNISECLATSQNTTAKLIRAFYWRTTGLRAERVGQIVTFLLGLHIQSLARSLAQKLDRLLGRSQGHIYRQLSRHKRAAQKSSGSKGLPTEAG